MAIIIVYSLIVVVSMYFIYRSFIYIYKNMKLILLGHLKMKKTDETIFKFYKKVIINYDYYKEEINCMNKLTSEETERLHERPYFTFVDANRSSLSNDLFL